MTLRELIEALERLAAVHGDELEMVLRFHEPVQEVFLLKGKVDLNGQANSHHNGQPSNPPGELEHLVRLLA